jgi:hypothetical protein
MKSQVLITRCEDKDGIGLVAEKGLDCKTMVINSMGNVAPVEYDGVFYLPCNVGDNIVFYYEDKKMRSFKVVDIERSGHFFVCEILYDEIEQIEMELLTLAEQVENNNMTVNNAHLKADQLIVSFLYKKGFPQIADAFNKVPKYYE